MATRRPPEIFDFMRQEMADDLEAERSARARASRAAPRKEHHSGPLDGTSSSRLTPAGQYRPSRAIDVHELLKHETFATTAASCDDHFEKNRPCPSAVYGVSDQYVILDSYEKVRDSRTDRGEFRFNFMIQGVTRDQAIGVKDSLDTVIGMQVCEFCIPLLAFDVFDPALATTLRPGLAALGLVANGALPAGDAVSNPQAQTPYCSRVTMLLKEIGLQSFSDADNRRHHFEFEAEVVGAAPGDRILLTPLHHCGFFLFTDPIQDIHGLTVCFYNPGDVIKFAPDCLYEVSARANGAQLLEFSHTDPSNLVNLAVGDRITICGFASGDATLNSWVGRPEGHLVGAGGFVIVPPSGPNTGTSVTFRLNPDVSTAGLSPPIPANTAIASATQIVVCIAKNRVRIPIRFRRVVPRLTQYVAP